MAINITNNYYINGAKKDIRLPLNPRELVRENLQHCEQQNAANGNNAIETKRVPRGLSRIATFLQDANKYDTFPPRRLRVRFRYYAHKVPKVPPKISLKIMKVPRIVIFLNGAWI